MPTMIRRLWHIAKFTGAALAVGITISALCLFIVFVLSPAN